MSEHGIGTERLRCSYKWKIPFVYQVQDERQPRTQWMDMTSGTLDSRPVSFGPLCSLTTTIEFMALSCLFVCRLKRVLVGHWPDWPSSGRERPQRCWASQADVLIAAESYRRVSHSGRTDLFC